MLVFHCALHIPIHRLIFCSPSICYNTSSMASETPPPSSTATASSPIDTQNGHSNLKQRRGQASSLSGLAERRGSALSSRSYRTDSSSSARPFSMRSSTEDLLSPRVTGEEEELHHETSLWHSLPILFAIVPAIGGLFSKNGSVFVTDLALLGLAGLYLQYTLVTPWHWYHSSQSRVVETYIKETTIDEEDDLDDEVTHVGDSKSQLQPQQPPSRKSSSAIHELRLHELAALLLCFLGPLLGSYILHIIRLSLSRASDDLVSSLHLTLFVLCAEIRPLRHAIKMMQQRTLFLQRVIREGPSSNTKTESREDIRALNDSLTDLEASLAELSAKQAATSSRPSAPSITSQIEESETTRRMQSQQGHLQTQVDALTRAVRRYEKRATAQTMQTEARLQDLESRLRDTISLAAVAANASREKGVIAEAVTSATEIMWLPMKLVRVTLAWPMMLVERTLTEIMVLFGIRSRQAAAKRTTGAHGDSNGRGKAKGSGEGYAR
jgi:hypothetical protein